LNLSFFDKRFGTVERGNIWSQFFLQLWSRAAPRLQRRKATQQRKKEERQSPPVREQQTAIFEVFIFRFAVAAALSGGFAVAVVVVVANSPVAIRSEFGVGDRRGQRQA